VQLQFQQPVVAQVLISKLRKEASLDEGKRKPQYTSLTYDVKHGPKWRLTLAISDARTDQLRWHFIVHAIAAWRCYARSRHIAGSRRK
jgi:hypothetical protein